MFSSKTYLCIIVFLLINIGRLESQSECEKCSCDGYLIDRIIELEVDRRLTKKDFRLLEENLTLIRDEVRRIGTELKQNKFNSTEVLETAATPMIAFSAYNPANITYNRGQIIIFRSSFLNAGGAYDTSSGIFTAPVKGLYHFTAHFCNAVNKFMIFAIFHGEVEVALSAISPLAPVIACNSVSALTSLQKGEKVTIRAGAHDDLGIFDNIHRRSSFVGMLVHL